jgi:tetratricopeptide (TPR) repeat protein
MRTFRSTVRRRQQKARDERLKRKERHHLRENELAHTIASTREFVGRRKREVGAILTIVVLAAVVVIGVAIVRNRTDSRGQDLLAAAKVALNARVVPATGTSGPGQLPAAAEIGATGSFPTEEAKLNAALPKLKAAAEAYPNSAAGIEARYHYAGALAALGRHAEAVAQFDDVLKRGGSDSLYGRMAALGKADTQAKSGQIDAAIASWKELAEKKDARLPEDAILMELGRAYQTKGSTDEARKTFTRLVDEYPESAYATEARAALDSLKG